MLGVTVESPIEQQLTVERRLISLLAEFVEDWGVEQQIGPQTRLVADLEFESIDIIQLIVAIEQHFQRRDFRFDELLMTDGRYVDDLSVDQISRFLEKRLALG